MSKPREITPEERELLLSEGPNIFHTHGVINHERSVFARVIADEVIGSSHPLFASMQPKIKIRPNQAWKYAYSFVLAFLQQNRADETRQTVDMELDKTGVVEKPEILVDECPGTQDEFMGLLQFIPGSDDDFQERVSTLSVFAEASVSDSPARPVGEQGSDAFLTQPTLQSHDEGEDEEEDGSEYDGPQMAESGVQMDSVEARGRGNTGVGLNSSEEIVLDFEATKGQSRSSGQNQESQSSSLGGIDLEAFDIGSDG
jgi:hypothetical protein